MSSFWVKIRADLGMHKSRSLLVIVSIAIGLFAVSAVLSLVDLQLDAMDAAHRDAQPSHISLILRNGVDAAVLDELRQLDQIEDIDGLTQITVRYKPLDVNAWKLGTLIWRPDYQIQKYDLLTLAAGAWPASGAINVERLSAKFANLQLGDTLSFATDTGSTRELRIAGLIRHPFVKPPQFGGQLHFFIDDSLAESFGIDTHRYKQLLVRMREPYDADRVRDLASELRAQLAQRGVNVNATLLQDPNEHWGRPFFAGINLVLQVMAWALLALGCVLVINTITAHITQQVNQIGILKAIGAGRAYVAGLYFTEVLILAVCALLVALPAGAWVAYLGTRWLLNIFNIDFASFQYSLSALGWTLAGGLAVPLLASLWPILKGAGMSVREAIGRQGLGADFGTSRIDRWVERFTARYLPTLYAVALGNLFRRKGRLIWTQSVLIIAGVVFLVVMTLIRSLNLTLDNELARSRYDIRLGFMAEQSTDTVMQWLEGVQGTRSLEFWDRTAVELSRCDEKLKQTGSLGAQLIALPATTELFEPLVVSGRWFSAKDTGTRSLVISADTAELNRVKVGDRIDLRLHGLPTGRWEILGTYRSLAGSNYAIEPVYAPRDTLQRITKRSGQASVALLKTDLASLADETDYLDRLRQLFDDHQVALDVYSTNGKREQRQFAQNQYRPVISMLLGLASMVASVGAIGMSGTLALGVLQRVREIGVLRSLGASSTIVFSLFVMEGIFHGLLAWACSIPLAYLLAPRLAQSLGLTMLKIQLDYAFNYVAVWIWLGIVVLISILASAWPARSAVKLSVRTSLEY